MGTLCGVSPDLRASYQTGAVCRKTTLFLSARCRSCNSVGNPGKSSNWGTCRDRWTEHLGMSWNPSCPGRWSLDGERLRAEDSRSRKEAKTAGHQSPLPEVFQVFWKKKKKIWPRSPSFSITTQRLMSSPPSTAGTTTDLQYQSGPPNLSLEPLPGHVLPSNMSSVIHTAPDRTCPFLSYWCQCNEGTG